MPCSDVLNLFYGYPAELLMQWCCVSRSTAMNLKAGQPPSKRVLRLFELHRDGRVLTDEWQGWGVRKGKLCDPEGHETSQEQLRAYPFVWQLAAEYSRQNEAARKELSRLITWQLKAAASGNPRQPEAAPDAEASSRTWGTRRGVSARAEPSGKRTAAVAEEGHRTPGTLRQRGPKGRLSGGKPRDSADGYKRAASYNRK